MFDCDHCHERLSSHEPFWVLTVSIRTGDPIRQEVYATDDQDDFAWSPVYLCMDCMEELRETVCDHRADLPPVGVDDNTVGCDFCNDGARAGELIVRADCYTLRQSSRQPLSKPMRVGHYEDTMCLCIACARYAYDQQLLPWFLTQKGECEEGTAAKCWRYGCPKGGCTVAA